MYVAITRAKDRLFITNAQSRFLFGDRQYPVRSRFITELAAELGLPSPKPRVRTDDGYNRYVGERRPFEREKNESSSASVVSSGYSSGAAKKFSEAQKLKPQVSADKFGNYVVGKKVRHVKFGEGIIVGIKGSGASKIADVAFKGVGVKSLSIQFAPMELIEK